MSERKASIHINPVKSTSEQHNTRDQELDYVFPEHTHENEHWVSETIADREKTIKRLCKQVSGRKLQKNAEPIREGVVNLQAHHTMKDLHKLKEDLEEKWGFEIFQMHIQRDEGQEFKDENKKVIEPKKLNPDKVNYHAHLIFDWQNKETGKMLRYARGQMAALQTDVAESLGMERGKRRGSDKRTANERLSPIEYKVKERGKELAELQAEVTALEQKKNQEYTRYCEVLWATPGSSVFAECLAGGEVEAMESLQIVEVGELEEAIDLQSRELEENERDIEELGREVERDSRAIEDLEGNIQQCEQQIEDSRRDNEAIQREIGAVEESIRDEEENQRKLEEAIERARREIESI